MWVARRSPFAHLLNSRSPLPSRSPSRSPLALPSARPARGARSEAGRQRRQPMNVTLLEQHSRATCVHGVSFGSNSNRPAGVHILPKQLASASVVELFWVRNCRGVFRCGPTGSPIACGYPVGRPSYTCRCDSPVWSFTTGANIGRWESCGVWSNASEAKQEPARPPTRRSDLLLDARRPYHRRSEGSDAESLSSLCVARRVAALARRAADLIVAMPPMEVRRAFAPHHRTRIFSLTASAALAE